MNGTRIWTLALLAGLFGAGDWFLTALPADDDPDPKPGLKVGEAVVTASLQDAGTGEDKEKHAILNLPGTGDKPAVKKIKVRLRKASDNSNSRYAALGRRAVLEKEISMDAAGPSFADLGPLPGSPGHYTLAASADGKSFVPLLWWFHR